MPNIEIKARCNDLKKALEVVNKIKTDYMGNLHQVDTYYETKEGRLKLREIDDVEAQLIPYHKEYSTGPMKSSYSVLPVKDKENLKIILEKVLGQVTVVDKQREVFLINNVRVHLDTVKGLGTFIEFEAVYEERSPSDREKEIKKVHELMDVFKIEKDYLLDKSYIDYFLDKDTGNLSKDLRGLLYFTNDSHSIIEIEKLDIDKSGPPEQHYFWFLFDKKLKKLNHLNFLSMKKDDDCQYRQLDEINLKFDSERAEVEGTELNTSFQKIHPMFIDKELKNAIEVFFNE